jgi:hypothetical protein
MTLTERPSPVPPVTSSIFILFTPQCLSSFWTCLQFSHFPGERRKPPLPLVTLPPGAWLWPSLLPTGWSLTTPCATSWTIFLEGNADFRLL